MTNIANALQNYASEASRLAESPTTTEPTYYPAVRILLDHILSSRNLPFDARVNTSEVREGGEGRDLPDLALYDGTGDFVVVCGEVKLPDVDLEDLAVSTERNNQIGRYLAKTNAVLLSNIRTFGLLTPNPEWEGEGPVPPEHRRLEQVVELWPSPSSLRRGEPLLEPEGTQLGELVEIAATRYAPIAEPESLARILARQARRAKADLPVTFSRSVRGLLDDFGEALGITFEGPEGEEFFRSSLIQTAFYALFSGWVLWRLGDSDEEFEWEDLGRYLKIPFLAQLFHEFRHPVRIKELKLAKHLDIAEETVLRVDADRFFARFRMPTLDEGTDESTMAAIVYFYEPFLEAFDPELRKELGVWYTPPEIVRYQVRRIDQILRDELECSRGFADERVTVLDPCCGTGAYLIEVMRVIADQLREDGEESLLGARLLDAFTRRVIGFEILTAPFVVAQLQLYLILSRLGTPPEGDDRPAVFLTNALTGWDHPEQLALHFPELQEEHDAAQEVKTEREIIVVLGNPPYNRFAGVPMAEEAELVDHYKGLKRDEEGNQVGNTKLYDQWGIRKHLLDDLYIRFFRLAEERIGERAPHGVVSFISNSSYLDGRSHPLMRNSLVKNFHAIFVDNLNGDKYRTGKVIPEGLPDAGSADQSIFTTEFDPRGIQVGTAISTFVKRSTASDQDTSPVWFRDFWGKADAKREALIESLDIDQWTKEEIAERSDQPAGPRPYSEVTPTEQQAWKFIPYEATLGYEDWPALDEVFPTAFQGVNPNRGLVGSVMDVERKALEKRMRDYFSDLTFEELEQRYAELCKTRARYDAQEVRKELLRASDFSESAIVPYLLFPFDQRWIYYETKAKLLNERRADLWRNLEGNEFLIAVPQPRRASEAFPLFATSLFDLHLHDRGSVGFPAEIKPPADLFSGSSPETVANLHEETAVTLADAWELGEATREVRKGLCRELFRICLALCHAPQYLQDNRGPVGQDWARVPIPRDADLAEELVGLGGLLVILLDPMRDASQVLEQVLGGRKSELAQLGSAEKSSLREEDLVVTHSYYGAARGRWESRTPRAEEAFDPLWGETTGDLNLNEHVRFRNVPERIWRFELGGYPVLKKWLGYRDAKRRDGAPLALSETGHFREIVWRIAAILLLHPQLDATYEKALGDAFTVEDLGIL